MKNLYYLGLVKVLIATSLISCSSSNDESEKRKEADGPKSKQVYSDSYEFALEVAGESCATQEQTFSAETKDELQKKICLRLKDNKANNNCAYWKRKQTFEEECPDQQWTVPTWGGRQEDVQPVLPSNITAKIENFINGITSRTRITTATISGGLSLGDQNFANEKAAEALDCGLRIEGFDGNIFDCFLNSNTRERGGSRQKLQIDLEKGIATQYIVFDPDRHSYGNRRRSVPQMAKYNFSLTDETVALTSIEYYRTHFQIDDYEGIERFMAAGWMSGSWWQEIEDDELYSQVIKLATFEGKSSSQDDLKRAISNPRNLRQLIRAGDWLINGKYDSYRYNYETDQENRTFVRNEILSSTTLIANSNFNDYVIKALDYGKSMEYDLNYGRLSDAEKEVLREQITSFYSAVFQSQNIFNKVAAAERILNLNSDHEMATAVIRRNLDNEDLEIAQIAVRASKLVKDLTPEEVMILIGNLDSGFTSEAAQALQGRQLSAGMEDTIMPFLYSQSAESRRAAIDLLSRIPTDRAEKAIIPLLGDSGVHSAAFEAIKGSSLDNTDLDLLTAELRSTQSPEVIRDILILIGKIRSAEAADLLIPFADRSSHISSWGRNQSKEEEIEDAAMTGLRNADLNSNQLDELARHLDSDREKVQLSVLSLLRNVSPEKLIPHIIPLLADSDESVRNRATEYLEGKELGSIYTEQLASTLFRAEKPEIILIIGYLSQDGSRRAAEALLNLSLYPSNVRLGDSEIKSAAREAFMSSVSDEINIEILDNKLQSARNLETKKEIISIIVSMNSTSARSTLIPLLSTQDTDVRTEVVKALSQMTLSSSDVSNIAALFSNDSSDIRVSVAQTLGIAGELARPFLEGQLAHENHSRVIVAIRNALTFIGS